MPGHHTATDAGLSTSAKLAKVAHLAEERDDYADLLATIRDLTIPADCVRAADALALVRTLAAMSLAKHGHLTAAEKAVRADCAKWSDYQDGQRRAATELAAIPNHTPGD